MKHLALIAAAGSMAAFAAPAQAAELPGAPASLFAGYNAAPASYAPVAAYGDDDWDDDDGEDGGDDEDWDDDRRQGGHGHHQGHGHGHEHGRGKGHDRHD